MRCIKYYLLLFWVIHYPELSAQAPTPSSGTLKRFESFSSRYVDPRNIDIWLPQGYDGTKKYAVLYMHDGQMLYDSVTSWNKQEWGADETLGELIAAKKVRDCIIVGVWNNGAKRHAEYFPQKAIVNLSDEAKKELLPLLPGEPLADNYLKFLVTELKPFIDSAFATLKDQKNTFLAGSSMGGLISMYAICEYPGIFYGAGCLSTHWIGSFKGTDNPIPAAILSYLEKHLPSAKNHKIYFDHSTDGLDSFYAPYQHQADLLMKQKGFTSKNWITKVFPGEDHSENAWRRRLSIPLLFLLKK